MAKGKLIGMLFITKSSKWISLSILPTQKHCLNWLKKYLILNILFNNFQLEIFNPEMAIHHSCKRATLEDKKACYHNLTSKRAYSLH